MRRPARPGAAGREPSPAGLAGSGALKVSAGSGALALARVRWGLLALAGPALSPYHGQPLGQHLFEVGDAAPLHQHVPMAARRLDLLGLGQVTGGRDRDRAADSAFPVDRDLRLGSKRHAEAMALRAIEGHLLTRGQIGVTVVLVARGSEPGAA